MLLRRVQWQLGRLQGASKEGSWGYLCHQNPIKNQCIFLVNFHRFSEGPSEPLPHAADPTPPSQEQGFRSLLAQNRSNTLCFCIFRRTSILTPRISFFFFGFLSHCYGAVDAAGSTTLTRNRPRHLNLGITHKNFVKRALFFLLSLGRELCRMPIATFFLNSHTPLLIMDGAVAGSLFC